MVGTARFATSSAGGPGDDYKTILILTMKILMRMVLKMMSLKMMSLMMMALKMMLYGLEN